MIDVDTTIREFATYLSAAYPSVVRLWGEAGVYNLLEDWLQASWEMTVEPVISKRIGQSITLAIYGDGADCHADSSRVFLTTANRLPTHVVVVRPREEGATAVFDVFTGSELALPDHGVPMSELVAWNGWHERTPPFDHVFVQDMMDRHVFGLDSVRFFVRPIRAEEI